jgi:hypothetical protein
MAPVRGFGSRALLVAAVFGSLLAAAPPAHALRLVDYNVTNYPNVLFPARQPYFRTVFAPLNADIVVCQEFTSQAGVDSFRTNVLNVNEPGQWASAPFFNGNDTDNALFYKPAKVQVLGAWAFYPNPADLLRYVTVWRLKPVGYGSGAAEFRVYSQHLKASTGFESQRLAEATGIRDSMNAMPPGTHAIALGDWNFYKSSSEPGYWKLQEVETSNVGRVYDPLNPLGVTQDWHDNATFVNVFTQCPCVTCPSGSGFSGGGLDDRFDQIYPTLNFQDADGLGLVAGSYVVVGEDSLHWNKNITDAPTIPEGATYANALWNASDHLPSRLDLRLPARVSASTSPLAFGTVIVGATPPSQTLAVSNPAVPPADTLAYSYAAPAGFSAPAGVLDLLAGDGSLDPISLATATPGAFSGNLLLASNDLDTPSLAIPVSGTVLAHASASLDSLAVVTDGTLDFGSHPAGDFADQLARVHNPGFDALHARLSVSAAAITGPDAARFSIVGGFSPALVGGSGAGWNVHFDDTGAADGTTYAATLTFTCADEPLPGAAPQPSLALALKAEVPSGATAVGPGGLPTVTRLYAPYPNPLGASSVVRFDLARPSPVTLEVFDLSGRRVARIADGTFAPGSYSLRWDGRAGDGRALGAGLYFVRMSGRNVPTASVRLAVVR